jgi:hypothetical protein
MPAVTWLLTFPALKERGKCFLAIAILKRIPMVEVMLLGVVFLVGLGAVAAAVIIVAMRLLRKNEPDDPTPLS